jgi:hypothetical protein
MPAGMQGQSSNDFARGPSALRILHLGVRNDIGDLCDDAFTQLNPGVVTTAPSTTLTGITKRGILGGSVAITRPDAGNGKVGGAKSSPTANHKPLGLFINDALGNPFENAPAVASGKGPYVSAMGSYGSRLFETLQQTTTGGGAVGDALSAYGNGQSLYCSVNGYLTNRANDSIEISASVSLRPIAVVITANSSSFPELVFNLLV